MMKIHYAIILAGTLIILASFIFAYKLKKEKEQYRYFNFFYCIPLIELLTSINTFLPHFFYKIAERDFFILQNLFFVSQFAFTCLFFYKIAIRKTDNYIIKIIFYVTFVIICFIFLINDWNKSFFQLYAVPSLAISILCLHYFYKAFSKETFLNLLKTPNFWIATGLFISSSINLPLFAIQEYFNVKFGFGVSYYILFTANIMIIIKHLFFMKGYRYAKVKQVENELPY